MKLEAFKYYYAPAGATGVAGSARSRRRRFQAAGGHHRRRAAVHGGERAHRRVHRPARRSRHRRRPSSSTCRRSCRRCPAQNFNPHVSTGVAPRDYLDTMLTEPFESFTFSPAGAAVYQLGPFGTAAKLLEAVGSEAVRHSGRRKNQRGSTAARQRWPPHSNVAHQSGHRRGGERGRVVALHRPLPGAVDECVHGRSVPAQHRGPSGGSRRAARGHGVDSRRRILHGRRRIAGHEHGRHAGHHRFPADSSRLRRWILDGQDRGDQRAIRERSSRPRAT